MVSSSHRIDWSLFVKKQLRLTLDNVTVLYVNKTDCAIYFHKSKNEKGECMRYHIMESNDIRMNLATEEYLMDHADIDEPLLLLYIQNPCVIIGRNQNAYEEINLHYLRENDIILTRRISGGGAVYDDLGNISFSFVTKKNETIFGDYQGVTQPILHALHRMGATQAQAGGRNDLYIDGKKFSGNAMYTKHDRTYSHGTLMYHVDLSVLDQLLNVAKEKIASKATPSVRKNVTNVRPFLDPKWQTLSTEGFRDQLLCELYQVENLNGIVDKRLTLTAKDRQIIQKLFDEKYANDQWIYGETPAFDIERRTRIPNVGIVDVKISTKAGAIESIHFFGDFFGALPIDELEQAMIGLPFVYESVASFLDKQAIETYILHFTKQACLELLFD